MADTPIKVPLDDDTFRRLREFAEAERRATADQAAVILTRALARRDKRRPDRAAR